jgi:hypothetical protein
MVTSAQKLKEVRNYENENVEIQPTDKTDIKTKWKHLKIRKDKDLTSSDMENNITVRSAVLFRICS